MRVGSAEGFPPFRRDVIERQGPRRPEQEGQRPVLRADPELRLGCLPYGPPCEQPSGCQCLPPDTNGDIGGTQHVQMVNTDFRVFSRRGDSGGEPCGECIAVSTSNDATGPYYLYEFLLGADTLGDYPKIAGTGPQTELEGRWGDYSDPPRRRLHLVDTRRSTWPVTRS